MITFGPSRNQHLGVLHGLVPQCHYCEVARKDRAAEYLAALNAVPIHHITEDYAPQWRWLCSACLSRANGPAFRLTPEGHPAFSAPVAPVAPAPPPPPPQPPTHRITTYGLCMGYVGDDGPLNAAHLIIERPSTRYPWRVLTEPGRWSLPLLHTPKRPRVEHKDAARFVFKPVKITVEIDPARDDDDDPNFGDVP